MISLVFEIQLSEHLKNVVLVSIYGTVTFTWSMH